MGHREWPPGPCGHPAGVRAGKVAQDSEDPVAGSEEEEEEETPSCFGHGVLLGVHFWLHHSAVDLGTNLHDFFFFFN